MRGGMYVLTTLASGAMLSMAFMVAPGLSITPKPIREFDSALRYYWDKAGLDRQFPGITTVVYSETAWPWEPLALTICDYDNDETEARFILNEKAALQLPEKVTEIAAIHEVAHAIVCLTGTYEQYEDGHGRPWVNALNKLVGEGLARLVIRSHMDSHGRIK